MCCRAKIYRLLLPVSMLCLTLAVLGCNNEQDHAPARVEVQYLVLHEEKLTLSSTLPGRVTALITAEVRPQIDGIILERLFEEGSAE